MTKWRTLATVSLAALLLPSPLAAQPLTLTVDHADDDPVANCEHDPAKPAGCTLREALIVANASGRPTTIDLPAGTYRLSTATPCPGMKLVESPTSTFSLTRAFLCITGDVTIVGDDAATTVVDAQQHDRVFFVSAQAHATLSRLTITGGRQIEGFTSGQGGGINNQGALTITDSLVTGNTSIGTGGGTYNDGDVTIRRSTFRGNLSTSTAAVGAAVGNNLGAIHVFESTFAANRSNGGGGAIGSQGNGLVQITASTLSGNVAGAGGAIFAFRGSFEITNSTISGNSADRAGGLNMNSTTSLVLSSVTITANAGGGGGGLFAAGRATLRNTLLAGNSETGRFAAPDCMTDGVRLVSAGFNLLGTAANCDGLVNGVNGDRVGTAVSPLDARLATLADSGGSAATHALLAGSPAIDRGNPAGCTDQLGNPLATDQRGQPRSADGDGDGTVRCDIGAFERVAQLTTLGISGMFPMRGGDGGTISATIFGAGFTRGSTVKLTQGGQPDIVGASPVVSADGDGLYTSFDLTGRAQGSWQVVVTDTTGRSAELDAPFTIEPIRLPQLWADVIGRSRIAFGRPATFTMLVGNRGNVDAFGVVLTLSASKSIGLPELMFNVEPPPRNPEMEPTLNPIAVESPATRAASTVLPFIVAVVPAGFVGAFRFTVTAPFGEPQPFRIEAAARDGYFIQGVVDDGLIDEVMNATAAYTLAAEAIRIPDDRLPEVRTYVAAQLQSVVEIGRDQWRRSPATTALPVFSWSQLVMDAADFATLLVR